MISFTDAAINQLKKAIEPGELVRVGVQGGGCSGMTYALTIVTDVDEEDMLFEFDHVKVYIDAHSSSILEQTTIDFIKTLQQEGFVFNNSQANTTCGCGMSFS